MSNLVQMNENLGFGRYANETGGQLLRSSSGTSYLKWVYENTDITLSAEVYRVLVESKIIPPRFVRKNSKAGGGYTLEDNDVEPVYPNVTTIIVEGGNLNCLTNSVVYSKDGIKEGRAHIKHLRETLALHQDPEIEKRVKKDWFNELYGKEVKQLIERKKAENVLNETERLMVDRLLKKD